MKRRKGGCGPAGLIAIGLGAIILLVLYCPLHILLLAAALALIVLGIVCRCC